MELKNKIAIVERGDCTFIDKARRAQKAGAKAVIVIDNVPDTSIHNQPMFAMSGDGTDDITIPAAFLFTKEAESLKLELIRNPDSEVFSCNLSIFVPKNTFPILNFTDPNDVVNGL